MSGVTLNVAVPTSGRSDSVGRAVERQRVLADPHVHRAHHRLEAPGEAVDVGVEAHGDRAVEHGVGGLRHALRGAAVAGHLAEQLIERHGGIGHAEHARRATSTTIGADALVATLHRAVPVCAATRRSACSGRFSMSRRAWLADDWDSVIAIVLPGCDGERAVLAQRIRARARDDRRGIERATTETQPSAERDGERARACRRSSASPRRCSWHRRCPWRHRHPRWPPRRCARPAARRTARTDRGSRTANSRLAPRRRPSPGRASR